MSDPEHFRSIRCLSEPSNGEIMRALSSAINLKVFCVANKGREPIYVIAGSRRSAAVIAFVFGHIKSMENASFQSLPPNLAGHPGLKKAADAGEPGVAWIHDGFVVMREKVHYNNSLTERMYNK